MKKYSDDVIRKDSDSIFGNIANRRLPLSGFEVTNISYEIQRLIQKIQFYQRWNCALSAHKQRLDSRILYAKILDALASKGFYDEKSQKEVHESTKVFVNALSECIFE